MLIEKKGYPEKSDLCICIVSKIQYNSIFVTLEEYGKKQGLIHISEISPGRIRNIRDYVKEGKVIVCVVLRVNRDRDLIELSLRRVTESQRRNKIDSMKQEQKAEKLIEFVAKSIEGDVKQLTAKIVAEVEKEYNSVHDYFEDIVTGNETIEMLKLDKKTSDALLETIQQRIKLPEVHIKGRLNLITYDPGGLEFIKKTLKKAQQAGGDKVKIVYLGAGKYDIGLVAEDYKTAEKLLDSLVEQIEKDMKKHGGECSFKRTDK